MACSLVIALAWFTHFDPPVRRDLSGDPIPAGAAARLGTIRCRHSDDGRNRVYAIPSPDGRFVATWNWLDKGESGRVRVWQLSDGKPLCDVPWTATDRTVVFSQDGNQFIILLASGATRFHETATGKVLRETKPAVGKERNEWDQSIAGSWIVSGGNPPTVTALTPDADRHQVNLELPTGYKTTPQSTYRADGATIVSFRNDVKVRSVPTFLRWDSQTGQLLSQTPLHDSPTGLMTALSRNGKRFAGWKVTDKQREELLVWNTETGQVIAKFTGGDRRGYGNIALSPDGKRIIADVGNDKSQVIRLWDIDSGKTLGETALPGWCDRHQLLSDGRTVLATSWSRPSFGTWDIIEGKRLNPLSGHEASIESIQYTSDGQRLITASSERTEPVTLWHAATGRRQIEFLQTRLEADDRRDRHASVVQSADGALITVDQGKLTWTARDSGLVIRRVELPVLKDDIYASYYSAHHETMTAVIDSRGDEVIVSVTSFVDPPYVSRPRAPIDVVTVLDAKTGRVVRESKVHASVVVSSHGALARHEFRNREGHTLSLQSAFANAPWHHIAFKTAIPDAWNFSPDGHALIVRTIDDAPKKTTRIRVREVRSGGLRSEFEIPEIHSSVKWVSQNPHSRMAISPDQRFLATAHLDNRLLIWDLATGQQIASRTGFDSLILSLAFRPDGQAIASGHQNGTALVWELPELTSVTPAACDREAMWADLKSEDAAKADAAIRAMIRDPASVTFLANRLQPIEGVPDESIQKSIRELDSNDFTTRESATKDLIAIVEIADESLQKALAGPLSSEQKKRIQSVLENRKIIETDPEMLRSLRAVEVLERIGTRDAQSILKTLAHGARGARLTGDAMRAVRQR